MPPSEHSPSLGNWLLGILAGLVVIAIGGGVAMLYTKLDRVEINQSEFKAEQVGMKRDVEWIKNSVSDIYTEKEADKRHAELDRTDQDLYGRWRNLDERVRILENNDK